jgi:hypothetical protein
VYVKAQPAILPAKVFMRHDHHINGQVYGLPFQRVHPRGRGYKATGLPVPRDSGVFIARAASPEGQSSVFDKPRGLRRKTLKPTSDTAVLNDTRGGLRCAVFPDLAMTRVIST